jgi:hypothetical protein
MNPNGYPFMTPRQISERINSDAGFAVECVAILQERHDRRGTAGSTASMGERSSHLAKIVRRKFGPRLRRQISP